MMMNVNMHSVQLFGQSLKIKILLKVQMNVVIRGNGIMICPSLSNIADSRGWVYFVAGNKECMLFPDVAKLPHGLCNETQACGLSTYLQTANSKYCLLYE